MITPLKERKCLAFAYDLALLAQIREDTLRVLENLDDIAEKTGFKVSFGKTKNIEYTQRIEIHGSKSREDHKNREDQVPGRMDPTWRTDLKGKHGKSQKTLIAPQANTKQVQRAISYKAKIKYYNTAVNLGSCMAQSVLY